MNLYSAFSSVTAEHPEKLAVFWGDKEFKYRELLEGSEVLGNRLRAHCDVKPGDRVGIWMKNRPEFIEALFGILQAGAVAVPINNFLKASEIGYILSDAGIDTLITESGVSESIPELKAVRQGLRVIDVDADADRGSSENVAIDSPERLEGDLAVIIYTSGTTGRPKGAMLSHGNLLHNVESCRKVLEAVDADRFVVVLPMFHSFMLCVGIFLPLLVGGSIVVIKSLHPAKNVLQEIIQRQATLLPAIPQFFRTLAHVQIPDGLPLRVCLSGAAPLPLEVLRAFNERVPVPLLEGYGLSEASPVVSINPIRGPWKAGSIGRPIPDVEMSVQSEHGEHLPDGDIGEICVRGGNVMQGYWNQPDETAKALKDGWLLTGDVGYRDSDGYYYITDRKKDMLLVNGINVYPREIEEVLYQFPGVREAAVIGVPDSRKGEQPVAFVASDDGVVLDEFKILEYLKRKLAAYKVPRRIEFLPNLPRNPTGKILKTELRKLREKR
ncbi:MAG: long-chain fatty acid--CoA ligase [Verrucomicrobia bacterium]|nr:long-chain fatty acid--CoA ligase [Verrucomicrobiota bacterium]